MKNDHDSPVQPDYSQQDSWASKSDLTPHPVDVFYVFPTIYAEESPLNMDIMNRPDLQAKVQGLMIAQAGVYSRSANLFAPYHR